MTLANTGNSVSSTAYKTSFTVNIAQCTKQRKDGNKLVKYNRLAVVITTLAT